MRKREKQPKQNGGMAKRVMVLLLLAVFLFSLYRVLHILQGYRTAQAVYDKAAQTYMLPVERMDGNAQAEEVPPQIDFEGLRAVNRDVIGWIFIEGTDVNYPLLAGADNQQYLFQSYMKKYAVAGSIFLDYRCSTNLSDYHTVIYGHNMKNGMMFGELDAYQKADYLASHPYVYIIMADGSWNKYRVLACEHVSVESAVYDLPCDTKQKIKALRAQLAQSNGYAAGEAAAADAADGTLQGAAQSSEAKLLTLSTCTNDSRDDVRFAVHCVLEDMGKY